MLKRTILSVALALLALPGFAQVFPPASGGGGSFDGGSITNPLGLPDGTQASPSAYCSTNTDTGIWCSATGGFYLGLDNSDDAALGFEPNYFGFGDRAFFINRWGVVGNGFATGTYFQIEGNGIIGQGLGSQNNAYRIYNVGGGAWGLAADREWTEIGYAEHPNQFYIESNSAGTGSTRPINLYVDSATDDTQFQMQSNSVSINTDVDGDGDGLFTFSTNDGNHYFYFDGSFGEIWMDSASASNFDITIDDTVDSSYFTQDTTSFLLDADNDNDGDGAITLSTNNSQQTVSLDNNSVDLTSASGSEYYTLSLYAASQQAQFYMSDSLDIGQYTFKANSATIDADADTDGDGTVTLSTDAGNQTVVLDSDSVDISSNAGINMDVDGAQDTSIHLTTTQITLDADVDSDTEGTILLDAGNSSTLTGDGLGESWVMSAQQGVTVRSLNGTSTMSFSADASSGAMTLSQNTATDDQRIQFVADDDIIIDADVDNDGDGNIRLDTQNSATYIDMGVDLGGITISTDSAANQLILTSTGVQATVEGETLDFPAESGVMHAHQEGTSTLTDNSATNILTYSLADTEVTYGTLTANTYCTDGSDWVSTHQTWDFTCTNDADTEDCDFQAYVAAPAEAASNGGAGGSLATHDIGWTGGTNAVTFTLDADCSLTPTTLETTWEIEFHTGNVGVWKTVTEEN